MHNVRNRIAGNKRGGASEAVFERRQTGGKPPGPTNPKPAAQPAITPFLLAPSAPQSAEERLLWHTAAVPVLPGLSLSSPVQDPEPPPDRAARRRAAKAAARPKRKAQKAAGAKPPPRSRKSAKIRPQAPAAASIPTAKAAPPDRPAPRRASTSTSLTAAPAKADRRKRLPAAQTADSNRPSAIAPPPSIAAFADQIITPNAALASAAPGPEFAAEPAAARILAPITPAQAAMPPPAALTSPSVEPDLPAPAEHPSEQRIPLSERGYAPLPRSRAVARTGEGLIGRVVSWLSSLNLVPRKRRAPLPKAQTTLRPPSATPVTPVPTPAPDDDSLTRRMLLQLSEENARLRRELETLRLGDAAR
jgi:hypothetical protein